LNNPGTIAHQQIVAYLKARYPSIMALNLAWGTSFKSWLDLNSGAVALTDSANALMAQDLSGFAIRFARKYFQTVRQAIVDSGYQGLYLGCRFTKVDYTPEILQAGKEAADVLSFNIYNAYPSHTNPDLKSLNFPIMISEFCFGASDQGRVGMSL